MSGRSLRPDLFIVARARVESAEAKLPQAGADRVVNPQQIGGARMAAFALQPHVAEFLDVVMHDGSLEFRLAEVADPDRLAGGRPQPPRRPPPGPDRGAGAGHAGRATGEFTTNPAPDTVIEPGHVLIAIGTDGPAGGARRDVVAADHR